MTSLTLPIFTDAEKAREHLEIIRWPSGKPSCPHCGVVDQSTLMHGKSHRPGLYQCNACREPFTVTVGTVMEKSHVPLNKWVLAFHLMASSKKGISAHQLHRTLGVTYKTAWFMAHRIREAMKPGANEPPMGLGGGTVEADETYIGNKRERMAGPRRGKGHKHAVVALVERGGRVRSFYAPKVGSDEVRKMLGSTVSPEAHIRTDESSVYKGIHLKYASHKSVNHSWDEYVRGEVSTNTVEGVFSIFKRGMIGTYQHCGEQHLQRYLAEFDFRYSNREKLGVNDAMRAAKALKGAEGKRLTYRKVSG